MSDDSNSDHLHSLEALGELARALLRGDPADEVLETLARRARELVRAHVATVALPSGADTLVLQVADGEHADVLRGATFPRDPSVSGDVIRTGLPILLDDAAADARASQPIVQLGVFGPTLFVPLIGAEEPFGTLLVGNLKGGARFSSSDLRLVETFAAQASVVVEHGRAQEERARLRLLEERDRIGQELHERVIRRLFSTGLRLEQLAGSLQGADGDTTKALMQVVDEIDGTIRELRSALYGRP